jgi:lipopolysaccharide heptosyltransferase II
MTLPRGAKPHRILVIKTQAIGDLLLTTPALRDLRASHPDAQISLMVGAWSAAAIRKNPNLNEVIEFEDRVLLRGHFWGALRLLWQIRKRRFDAAVIFHPSPFLHLFALLAGIPIRYGLTRGERNGFLTKGVPEDLGPNTYYPENFQRVVALMGAPTTAKPHTLDLEVHSDAEADRAASELLTVSGWIPGEPFLLVAPGGGRNSKDDVAAKRWPIENFIAVLQRIQTRWPTLRIVVTGSAGDREDTKALARVFPGAIDLTGATTLPQLFRLAAKAEAILCNDSALLHIGIANRTPVVVPFGPTLKDRFVPESGRALCIQSTTVCSPCYVGGSFPGCTIGYQCMREITPDMIYGRLEPLIENKIRPTGA